MQLTDREKEMRDGKDGEAVRIAMSILSDIGDAVGAEEMVEIAHVHTDSGFYLGDAGLSLWSIWRIWRAKSASPPP